MKPIILHPSQFRDLYAAIHGHMPPLSPGRLKRIVMAIRVAYR
jgi:hypothetical protein